MGNKHYINNAKFEKLISLYKQDPKKHEDELFGMFDLLISNILTGFSFKLDEDDAKQECFLLILKTLKNFQPSKGSAFNYFTTVIVNNLKLLYTKNKKYEAKLAEYEEIKGYKPSSS